MTDLEVNVLLSQRPRRIIDDVLEAVQTLLVFLLLLVNDAQTEVNLVGLLEVGRHVHDLRERLLGMLERPVAIVENANPIPQLGLLVQG